MQSLCRSILYRRRNHHIHNRSDKLPQIQVITQLNVGCVLSLDLDMIIENVPINKCETQLVCLHVTNITYINHKSSPKQ